MINNVKLKVAAGMVGNYKWKTLYNVPRAHMNFTQEMHQFIIFQIILSILLAAFKVSLHICDRICEKGSSIHFQL